MRRPPNHRIGVIQGLRALADELAAQPDLPVPFIADITYCAIHDTDAEQIAEIDRIAKILGVTVTDDDGHYRVARRFDSVEYRAVALSEKAQRRYLAQTSYRDSIRTDDDTENKTESGDT